MFEALVHQVKERLLPVTVPGFGIAPIYYYMGPHASAGLIARLFDLSPHASFFLVTRAVGILAVLFSVFGIGLLFGRVQPVPVWPAVTGAFTFFFIGSPMATALIFPETEYWGGGGGAKHLRGFLIAHSSLWLCATLLPVMGTLLAIVREKQKCDLRQTVTLAVLAGAAVMTNLLAGIGSAGLLLWRVFFQNGRNKLAEAVQWRIGRALVVLTFLGLFLWLSGLVQMFPFAVDVAYQRAGLASSIISLILFLILAIGPTLTALVIGELEEAKELGQLVVVAIAGYGLFYPIAKVAIGHDSKYGLYAVEALTGLFAGIFWGQVVLAERRRRQQVAKLISAALKMVAGFSAVSIVVVAALGLGLPVLEGVPTPGTKVAAMIATLAVLGAAALGIARLMVNGNRRARRLVLGSVFGMALLGIPGGFVWSLTYGLLAPHHRAVEPLLLSSSERQAIELVNSAPNPSPIVITNQGIRDGSLSGPCSYAARLKGRLLLGCSTTWALASPRLEEILKDYRIVFLDDNPDRVHESLARNGVSFIICRPGTDIAVRSADHPWLKRTAFPEGPTVYKVLSRRKSSPEQLMPSPANSVKLPKS